MESRSSCGASRNTPKNADVSCPARVRAEAAWLQRTSLSSHWLGVRLPKRMRMRIRCRGSNDVGERALHSAEVPNAAHQQQEGHGDRDAEVERVERGLAAQQAPAE